MKVMAFIYLFGGGGGGVWKKLFFKKKYNIKNKIIKKIFI